MPQSLPGLTSRRSLRLAVELDGRRGIALVMPAVCGGVSMTMYVTPERFTAESASRLARLREAVVKLRPSKGSLFWGIPEAR